jgi:hypothetical protein
MIQRQNQVTDDEIIHAYNEYKHLGKMAAKFKLPVIEIWRKCKKLDLKFSVGGANQKVPLAEILDGLHPYFQTGKVKKKILQENALEYKCVGCGITDSWNEKPIVLHLDHIDGDSSNHMKSNLRFLCPNCHSQTNTWCGRNK